ncbi:hypothetical protein L7F22_000078 [Adiantum nelumboides]|nr:hypothetical protein [Adiantum nelumboides]
MVEQVVLGERPEQRPVRPLPHGQRGAPVRGEHPEDVVHGAVRGQGGQLRVGRRAVGGPHHLGDDDPAQRLVGRGVGGEVDPASQQLERVDVVPRHQVRQAGGQDDGGHQRQDQGVVAGELEHDEHRGDRGVCGPREHRRHADQAERAGVQVERREQGRGGVAEGGPGGAADEQRRREDPAGPADADGEAGGEDLPDDEQEQEPDDVPAADRGLQHRVAHAVHLGQRQQQRAEQQPADGRAQPLRAAPDGVAGVLDGVEVRQGQDRAVPGDHLGDDVRDHRADHQHAERLGAERPQDQLQAEDHPGDRGVERRGDPARGAAGDHQDQPGGGHPQPLPDGRAERGADLHDRALPADGAAGADADPRCERLHRGDGGRDPTAPARDGQHHLRHPVPAGLRREPLDQRAVHQAAEHRGDEQEPDPQPGQVRRGDPAGVGEVVPAGDQPGHTEDQLVEQHRPDAGTDPDDRRQADEPRPGADERAVQRADRGHRAPSSAGTGATAQSVSPTSPAASAKRRSASRTAVRSAAGSVASSRCISARRSRVTSSTSARPAGLSATATSRRSSPVRVRATRPRVTSRSHIRVAVDADTGHVAGRVTAGVLARGGQGPGHHGEHRPARGHHRVDDVIDLVRHTRDRCTLQTCSVQRVAGITPRRAPAAPRRARSRRSPAG